MVLQDVRRIKDDREKQEDETHTLTRLISMRSMEMGQPGVEGQDHFYCNKHFSMSAFLRPAGRAGTTTKDLISYNT